MYKKEPTYAEAREQVIQVVEGKLKPSSSSGPAK
jgi:hypothetical protein